MFSSARVITFEYCITYRNKVACVSCFRKDTGYFMGDFINVKTMKEYIKRMYNLNRIEFERIYEKGGKESA